MHGQHEKTLKPLQPPPLPPTPGCWSPLSLEAVSDNQDDECGSQGTPNFGIRSAQAVDQWFPIVWRSGGALGVWTPTGLSCCMREHCAALAQSRSMTLSLLQGPGGGRV